MRKQEIFNIVVTHLLTQDKQSRRRIAGIDTCAYRGRNGLKCAIGVLIPDAVYNKDMEDKNVAQIVDQYPSFASLKRNTGLLMKLQSIHDRGIYPKRSWRIALLHVAHEHKLKVPKILKDRLDALL